MSSIEYFQSLSTKQKADLLIKQGSFKATRYEPAYVIDCYTWNAITIEVYYHKNGASPVVFRHLHGEEDHFLPEENIYYLYQDVICRHTA